SCGHLNIRSILHSPITNGTPTGADTVVATMPYDVVEFSWVVPQGPKGLCHSLPRRGLRPRIYDDRLGAGMVVQLVFEILRRQCFRDQLLRLRLPLGADT